MLLAVAAVCLMAFAPAAPAANPFPPAVGNQHVLILLTTWGPQPFAPADVASSFAEAARFYARPGVVYISVRDAPPIRWAFAWLTANANPLIGALADAATGEA